MSQKNRLRVVVCGGGVIGTSIAYFLSLRNVETLVVERAGVANAASGKSGGFLALDWCQGTPVDALARRSFVLHGDLASTLGSEMNLDWGYRRLDTLSVAASERRDLSKLARMKSPRWLGSTAAVNAQIGTEETTAQVNPMEFTQGLMSAAVAKGARLVLGAVQEVVLSAGGRRVKGVLVDNEMLKADKVVIAMGPWSILACEWLPLPAIYGLKGHSLVLRYTPPEPHALFVEFETNTGIQSPEVMPRSDGTTYVCGLSGDEPLPVDPSLVNVEPGVCDRLRAITTTFSPPLGAAEVLAEQACYRPVAEDGLPLIGRVPGVKGAFVATGHSVWGMLNGPATGEVMAELIVEGMATAVDIAPFNPGRLKEFREAQ